MISSKNLASAIYEISLDSDKSEKEITEAVLSYIKGYKLESILPKVIMRLEDKHKKDLSWNTLIVESSFGVDDYTIDQIKSRLEAKEAKRIVQKVEKNLIGGFVATYKGVIYDASLRNKLQLLRNTLTK
jgi:F0F1-type ATP synthase delta subunit